MDYNFNLDEVLIMLSEAIQAGYHYGSISVVEPDDEDGQSGEGAALWLSCADGGGVFGVEFDPIDSVPPEEVAQYGNQGQAPAPGRTCCEVKE